MSFFKITFHGQRESTYIRHNNGDQAVYAVIDAVMPSLILRNGIPASLEADGWADDQACIGDTFDGEEFIIECITEEDLREATGQEDTPTYQL